MNILSDLWMGNIAPAERTILPNSPYQKAMHQAAKLEAKLRSTLTPEQKHLQNAYADSITELLCLTETEAFTWGYRLGTQLLLAGLDREK